MSDPSLSLLLARVEEQQIKKRGRKAARSCIHSRCNEKQTTLGGKSGGRERERGRAIGRREEVVATGKESIVCGGGGDFSPDLVLFIEGSKLAFKSCSDLHCIQCHVNWINATSEVKFETLN